MIHGASRFLVLLLVLASCGAPERSGRLVDGRAQDVLVEASCGQCQFGVEGDGCDLAVRFADGLVAPVAGTGIDDHGDAHGEQGFCNAVRRARVSGRLEADVLQVESFELVPLDAP